MRVELKRRVSKNGHDDERDRGFRAQRLKPYDQCPAAAICYLVTCGRLVRERALARGGDNPLEDGTSENVRWELKLRGV